MDLEELLFYQLLPNIFYIVIIFYIGLLFYLRYARQERKKSELKLKSYTFEFCLKDKYDYMNIINELRFSNEITSNVTFFKVIDHFEKIAIGVENGLFDEDIIFSYYGDYFVLFYKELRYFAVEDKNELISKYFNLERIVQHFSNYDMNTFRSY